MENENPGLIAQKMETQELDGVILDETEALKTSRDKCLPSSNTSRLETGDSSPRAEACLPAYSSQVDGAPSYPL